MKKVSILLSIIVVSLFVSCEQNHFENQPKERNQPQESLKSSELVLRLQNDELFISLLQEITDFDMYLCKMIDESEFSFNDLQHKLEFIANEFPDDYETQLTQIGNVFDGDSLFVDRFRLNREKTSYLDSQLRVKHGKLYSDMAEDAIVDLLDQGIITHRSNCNWRYNLCIGAALSAAILCHGGCTAGTGGFGAPACVLLCLTMQSYASVLCYDSYC